jgi:hypothetical protein
VTERLDAPPAIGSQSVRPFQASAVS